MDNKEIVNRGLQARKDVRAAMACAAKFRDEAVCVRDARFYEQNRHRIKQREWQVERDYLLTKLGLQARQIQRMAEDHDELVRRLREVKKQYIIHEAAKTILAVILIACARDLGWIVAWLATVLLAASSIYLVYAVVQLTRLK